MNRQDTICYINSTFNCNHRCLFCVSNETVLAASKKSYEEITLNSLATFLKTVPDTTEIVHISGGEPLLHPEFLDILRMVAPKFSKIQIATNGVLLASSQFVEEIVSICSPQFIIPILGTSSASHLKLTKRDSWEKTIAGLKNVCAAKTHNSGIVLTVKMLLLKETIDQIPSIPTMLRDQSIIVDDYILSGLCRTTGALESSLIVKFPEAKRSINSLVAEFITSKTPFCLHRIPLCAIAEEYWPHVLTLSDDDRSIERAKSLSLYPGDTYKEILPHRLNIEVCNGCDLKQYCEIASTRNSELFDYSSEFHPIILSDSMYSTS